MIHMQIIQFRLDRLTSASGPAPSASGIREPAALGGELHGQAEAELHSLLRMKANAINSHPDRRATVELR